MAMCFLFMGTWERVGGSSNITKRVEVHKKRLDCPQLRKKNDDFARGRMRGSLRS